MATAPRLPQSPHTLGLGLGLGLRLGLRLGLGLGLRLGEVDRSHGAASAAITPYAEEPPEHRFACDHVHVQ